MSDSVRFFVPGIPVAQGSMRAFKHSKTDAVIVTHTKTKPLQSWRAEVVYAYDAAAGPQEPRRGPARVILDFRYARPRSHYRTGKNASVLKDSAPETWKVTPPDADKLARAVLDALTGVAWVDDAQVCDLRVTKAWANSEDRPGMGAIVTVDDA